MSEQQSTTVYSAEELNRLIRDNGGLLVYFGTSDCGVCLSLKPKILQLLDTRFPQLKFVYVDCAQAPLVAAQAGVFAVPTIVAYFAGKESWRRTRNLSIAELQENLQRPYALLFGTS